MPDIRGVDVRPDRLGRQCVTLRTARGDVDARLFEAPGSSQALLLVGGVGGGWDTPAMGLYDRLSEALPLQGITVLQVKYRDSKSLDEAVHDALAGLHFLASRGRTRIGVVGHSFGGAVAIISATLTPEVCAVTTLATQSHGTEGVAHLSPRPLLLIHGVDDEVLRPKSSVYVFQQARQPKEITLYEGSTHSLDEAADEVFEQVRDWMTAKLGVRQNSSRQQQPSAPVS